MNSHTHHSHSALPAESVQVLHRNEKEQRRGLEYNDGSDPVYDQYQPTHEHTGNMYTVYTPSKPIGYQFVATSTSSPNITVPFLTHAHIRVCIHYIMYLFQGLRYLVPLYKWGTNAMVLMKLVYLQS